MKSKLLISILFVISFNATNAQFANYDVSLIPDSLKENAVASVRYEHVIEEIPNARHYTTHIKVATTIFKKAGERYGAFVAGYNNSSKVQFISGKVYDEKGKKIKNLKRKNIRDFSAVSGFSLYEDNRVKYLHPPQIEYPYTIEYEYKLSSEGTFFVKGWHSAPGYKVSVCHSKYTLKHPNKLDVKIKETNFVGDFKESEVKNNTVKSWTVTNLIAFKHEELCNDYSQYVSSILVSLNDFKFGKTSGSLKTWNSFGKWIGVLNAGKQNLPAETILEIKKITADAKTDKEKAKIIYEFMQNKTRYVSVQIGIGGFQPFPAETVDKTGYGDCKALSNYTKALMNSVGIEAQYALVQAGKDAKNIKKDFTTSQFNHAILCLPLSGDTTWLECTSQTSPFGFISDFTDDREVLLITPEGGKLAHTSIYSTQTNKQNRKITLTFEDDGTLKANQITKYSGLLFNRVSRLEALPKDKQENSIKEHYPFPGFKLKNYSYQNYNEIIPSCNEKIQFSVISNNKKVAKRFFIKSGMFADKISVPSKISNRKTPIIIKRGSVVEDTIQFNLPTGRKIEYLPQNITHQTEFGTLTYTYSFSENQLTIYRKLRISSGHFQPNEYTKLREFYKFVKKADDTNIVFVLK